jgi:ribonuclease D
MSTLLVSRKNLDTAIAAIKGADLVVVDTEFHSERRYTPELYLVQLHVPGEEEVWVIDVLEKGILAEFEQVLTETNWLVHGGQQDMLLLHRAFGALPEHVFDTQIAAGLASHDHYPAGLSTIVSKYLNIELPKSETLSDWSKRPLTPQQLEYAAEDVLLLPSLWARLLEGVDKHGRRQVLQQACQEHRQHILNPPSLDERWTKIGGAYKLNRQQLAVLQELSAWREETAIHFNQPPRSVLSDSLLCQLAKKQPADEQSMRANRRFPRAVINKYGTAIIGCIQRASKRPEWAWPSFATRDSAAARLVIYLRAARIALALQHNYAANLVLPNSLLELLSVRDLKDKVALETLLGWRHSLCSHQVHSLLIGESALRIGTSGPEISH